MEREDLRWNVNRGRGRVLGQPESAGLTCYGKVGRFRKQVGQAGDASRVRLGGDGAGA